MAEPVKSRRFALLSLAWELLRAADSRAPGSFTVTIEAEGVEVCLQSRPGEFGRGGDVDLNKMQRGVLACFMFADEVLSARQIARKTGYSYSSHLRSCLASLHQEGLLSLVDGGYRLAEERDEEREDAG